MSHVLRAVQSGGRLKVIVAGIYDTNMYLCTIQSALCRDASCLYIEISVIALHTFYCTPVLICLSVTFLHPFYFPFYDLK